MAAPSIGGPQPSTNYLVPSSGSTHILPVTGVFTATPFVVDWRQFSTQDFSFQPQGVFIDNTQGAGTLTITIGPLNWNVTCPAGAQVQAQFPAPNGQTASIVGNGQASVMFVDFPVLPSAGVVTVAGTVNVNIASPNPVPVAPTVNAAGIPYQFTEVPAAITAFYNNAITGAVLTSGNITPAANQNLRKLQLSLTGNATMATAGLETVTCTLNGVQIYKRQVYIPAAIVPPNNGALTQTAGGTLAAVTYFVRSTWVIGSIESLTSAETSLAVLANNVLNVAAPANAPAGATGWNVYVSTVTGSETKQNTATLALGAAWVEPVTGLIAGSVQPTVPSSNVNGQLWEETINWDKLGLSAGAAGSLVVTVGTLLATGSLEINAYFG